MLFNNYIPRISIISGIVNRNDAISEAIVADLEAIDQLSGEQRRNFDVQIFCGESDFADTRVRIINSWQELTSNEHFRTSDLYYFQFGIYNELHNAMHFTRRNAKTIIFFQNVTQPQYCPPSAENLIHISYQQIENFLTADKILTASSFSAKQLESYGLDLDVEVVPLFGPNAAPAAMEPKTASGANKPLRLMFCGRFAPSKGVDQLLEALTIAAPRIEQIVEVTLAGNAQFSDPAYIAKLESYVADMPSKIQVTFTFDKDSETIRNLLVSSDALILPSMHEGFGMPVAEALLARTPVICSDAGSLPEVSGGFGLTYPAGDVKALADALARFCEAFSHGDILCDTGVMSAATWHRSVGDHADMYLRSAYVERMKVRFETWLRPMPSWRDSAREGLARLHPSTQSSDLANSWDCAVLAAVKADRFIEAFDRPAVALRAILAMVFTQDQSDDDVAYWIDQWTNRGTSNFITYLSNIADFRGIPARRQSSVFLRNAIFLAESQNSNDPSDTEIDELDDDIEIRLLISDSSQSASEFIRAVYLLILRREPDPAGAAHQLEQLRIQGNDRVWLIESIKQTDEARSIADKAARR